MRISMETPESDPAPPGSFVGFSSEAMTPLPVPDCGQHGTTSPDGEAKASHSRREGRTLGGPIRLPGHRKVDRRRIVYERKGGRPMVGPTLGRPTNLEVAVSGCTRRERSPDRSACLCP